MEGRKIRIGKAVSALMALILTFMFILTPVEAGTQTARGALCNECNYGEVVRKVTKYGDWNTFRPDCTHGYTKGYDVVRHRLNKVSYLCNYCGRGTWDEELESTVTCYGYR